MCESQVIAVGCAFLSQCEDNSQLETGSTDARQSSWLCSIGCSAYSNLQSMDAQCHLNIPTLVLARWAQWKCVSTKGICSESTKKLALVPSGGLLASTEPLLRMGSSSQITPPVLTNLGNGCSAEIKACSQIIHWQ